MKQYAAIPMESIQQVFDKVQELPYKQAAPILAILQQAKVVNINEEEAEENTDE